MLRGKGADRRGDVECRRRESSCRSQTGPVRRVLASKPTLSSRTLLSLGGTRTCLETLWLSQLGGCCWLRVHRGQGCGRRPADHSVAPATESSRPECAGAEVQMLSQPRLVPPRPRSKGGALLPRRPGRAQKRLESQFRGPVLVPFPDQGASYPAEICSPLHFVGK